MSSLQTSFKQYIQIIYYSISICVTRERLSLVGKPVASMLLAPSVTPWRARIPGNRLTAARNPGIRRVMMTRDYTRLLDVEQYYLPLTEANKQGVAEWKLEYSFRRNYKLKDASTASLQTLLDELKQSSSKYFRQYYTFNSVNAQTKSNVPCDWACENLHLCAIEHVEYDDCKTCITANARCSCAVAIPSGMFYVVSFSVVNVLALFVYG